MASSVIKSLEEVLRGLECSVCSQHYRKPKMLPCGHSLCAVPCLKHLIQHKRVTCPECRSKHDAPKGDPDAFPTNFVIQRLVEKEEKEPNQEELKDQGCPLCSKKTHLLECQHCDLRICERCRINHSLEFRETLKQLAGQVKERATTTLKQQSQVLEKSTSAVNKQCLEAEKVVNIASEKCLAAINAKANGILENIAQIGTRECSLIKQHCQSSEKSCEEASVICDKIIEALGDPGTFLTVGELDEMKQQLHNNLETVNRFSQKEVAFHKLHVDVGNESCLLSAYDTIISLKSEAIASNTSDSCHFSQHCLGSLIDRNFEKASLYCSWKTYAEGRNPRVNSLAVSPFNGDVMVCTSSEILVYDNQGTYKMTVGRKPKKAQPQIYSPHGLTLAQNGDIWISEDSPPLIRRFSSQGDHIQTIDIRDQQDSIVTDMAVDPEGFIHSCTYDVEDILVWSMAGELVKTYQPPKDDRVSGYPEYIAINTIGNIGIIVTTCNYSSGNDGYAVIGLNNQLETVGMAYEPDGKGSGVAITEDNYIIICDLWEHNVRIYTLDAQLLKVFGSTGKNVGQVFEPLGVAVTADGDILVTCNNGNVQKF